MSVFANGICAKDLGPEAPNSWIFEEDIVKTIGSYWHDYRGRSIEYKAAYPEGYTNFPEWDTISSGWERLFTPVTIPVTETSFGVIHGDSHTGNFMINDHGDSTYDMTVIDFDNAQSAWFIIDVGTEVWGANMEMFFAGRLDRLHRIKNMKEWMLESYGWDTTEEELRQGCQWRKDFMYWLVKGLWYSLPEGDPSKAGLKIYIDMNDNGLIPVC
jgi:thiamine kinase-like enzyme